jgi:hypothetical protein
MRKPDSQMVLNWELAQNRQALSGWRDRQVLNACEALNRLAQEALAAFEVQMSQANLRDTVLGPEGFTQPRIDAWMRARVPAAVDALLADAAKELARLHDDFASAAESLVGERAIVLPVDTESTIATNTALPADIAQAPEPGRRTPAALKRIGETALMRHATHFGTWLGTAVKDAGTATERSIQNRSGLYARLRDVAKHRIATVWLGSIGEPRPVLAQVLDLIDSAARAARKSNL